MNNAIESLMKVRAFAVQLMDGLSSEALNTIPEGFNNNIIWNLAHLVAAEQGICYMRAGVAPTIPTAFILAYTRGTKPTGDVSAADILAIRTALTASPVRLAADYAAGVFAGYKAWTTPYGVTLTTIDEALQFLLYHEGLHGGYIMALKRLVAL